MDIWEVLHWNSVVCNKDINPKLSEIESIIKTKLEQKEIRFEIIQSDRVMMKIDRISGISYMLWDRSYWEVYDLYLSGIINIAKDKRKEFRVRTLCQKRDYLTTSIYLFLALRIRDGGLSKKFAYAYRLEMSKPGIITSEMTFGSVIDDCEITQFFVAMHEKCHCLINADNDNAQLLIQGMEVNIRIAKAIIKEMSLSKVEKYYGMTKGKMLRLLNSVLEDENLKKDLICDASAFNDSLETFFERWKEKYSREKIINKCMEAIRVHGFFSSLVNALDAFWNNTTISINEIQDTMTSRIRRYDISELIFMIQLSTYSFNMDEVMKPDEFSSLDEKNSVFQEIICRFINEDNRNLWRQYDFNIKAKNKYELLEWRV